jgi:hypothetical protein
MVESFEDDLPSVPCCETHDTYTPTSTGLTPETLVGSIYYPDPHLQIEPLELISGSD